MSIRKKRKSAFFKTSIMIFLLLCIFAAVHPEWVAAATNAATAASTSKEEVTEYMPMRPDGGTVTIGRYQFNYTGNWNYFSNINAVYGYEDEVRRNTYISGYTNSSGATLTNSSNATGIVKAYLIWETRQPYVQSNESANHVRFIMKDGRTAADIYPNYVYNDNRTYSGWGNMDFRTCYVMVADVTNLVQAYGYGDYYVANIPEYHSTSTGGDNVCSWQLVVVEESKNFPVRALTLKVGSEWRFGDAAYGDSNYLDTNVQFSNGIKSKSTGNVSGQLLFGCANDHDSMYTNLITTLYTSDSSGNRTRVTGSTLSGGGLYRNGAKQIGEYGIITDLTSVTGGLSNNAPIVGAEVNNIYWNTLLFTGTAIDIAFPDFVSNQTTTVSNGAVTVAGKITNTSLQQGTGIYNGNLAVDLDSALKPRSNKCTVIVNGVKAAASTSITYVDGHYRVTFYGGQIVNFMQGNTIEYSIECDIISGKTRFDNSDCFNGYLKADGVSTGFWTDKAWSASSYALAKFKVTINAGEGIESVTGGGEYTYGDTVTIDAVPKPGYHWKDWTGTYDTPEQEYTFKMPASDVTLTATAERNQYILHFDSNGGAGTQIPDMIVYYGDDVTLPNGADFYKKYTYDGVNVTEDVMNGLIDIGGAESAAPDGAEGTEDGENTEDADGTGDIGETGANETGSESVDTPEDTSEDETIAVPELTQKSDKKAYESVYKGWSLEDGKDGFTPRWLAGEELAVSAIASAAGVLDTHGAVITLYATWDDSPWIIASDRYFTLNEARNGVITAEELLRTAIANDLEDGELLPGTELTLIDFDPQEFKDLYCDAVIRVTYQAVDSEGSVYKKSVYVYVIDDVLEPMGDNTGGDGGEPDSDPEHSNTSTDPQYQRKVFARFISSDFWMNEDGTLVSEEYGGVAESSVWRTDSDKMALLTSVLNNSKHNETEKEITLAGQTFTIKVPGTGEWDHVQSTWVFTPEDVAASKAFVAEHGWGNYKEADGLQQWYAEFSRCKQ